MMKTIISRFKQPAWCRQLIDRTGTIDWHNADYTNNSKTVLVETQMTADNYRIAQAVAAANYAMDYGVNYFDNGGFDQVINATGVSGHDDIPDNVFRPDLLPNRMPDLVSADGSQTTTSTLTFDNTTGNGCVATGVTPNMKSGKITATGFSDDALASRTITQCVASLAVLRNDGPNSLWLLKAMLR